MEQQIKALIARVWDMRLRIDESNKISISNRELIHSKIDSLIHRTITVDQMKANLDVIDLYIEELVK